MKFDALVNLVIEYWEKVGDVENGKMLPDEKLSAVYQKWVNEICPTYPNKALNEEEQGIFAYYALRDPYVFQECRNFIANAYEAGCPYTRDYIL